MNGLCRLIICAVVIGVAVQAVNGVAVFFPVGRYSEAPS